MADTVDEYDIGIAGYASYMMAPCTPAGDEFMENMEGYGGYNNNRPCGLRLAQDIANSAVAAGLRVNVNGHDYPCG